MRYFKVLTSNRTLTRVKPRGVSAPISSWLVKVLATIKTDGFSMHPPLVTKACFFRWLIDFNLKRNRIKRKFPMCELEKRHSINRLRPLKSATPRSITTPSFPILFRFSDSSFALSPLNDINISGVQARRK